MLSAQTLWFWRPILESRHPILLLKDLTTGYGKIQILRDVHLTVSRAEIVCIIGPNGAGKSTVLKAVYGLLHPWSGSIYFKGEDLSFLPVTKHVTRGMVLVHQDNNVFPNLTIHENLEIGGYLIPNTARLKSRLEKVFEQFPSLYNKRKHPARSLSGGERQLLAIGMALMTEPDLILLDEPSMGLAPQMMAQVFSWVKRIHKDGKAILMVEQNAKQALEIAHRGYVLDLGKNRFEGEAQFLLDDPKVKKLYLGGRDTYENLS